MGVRIMSVLNVNSAVHLMCDCSGRQGEAFHGATQRPSIQRLGGSTASRQHSVNNHFKRATGEVKKPAVDLQAIISMFSAFLSQLSALLSGRNEQDTVKVVPEPVRPEVKPTPVVPEPETAPTPLPDLSSKRNGAKCDDIWGGFRQGPDGNCVTVSAIKAAMHKFGQSPTDVYKRVRKTAQGYEVTMRDGYYLTVSHQELKQAAAGARFFGRDKGALKDAEFMFACSVKRAHLDNNDGRAARSFSVAIRSLNNGEDENGPGEGFQRLGLIHYMKRVPVSTLARGQVGMVNRALHSVAVIDGREELWGRKGRAPTYGDAVALIG